MINYWPEDLSSANVIETTRQKYFISTGFNVDVLTLECITVYTNIGALYRVKSSYLYFVRFAC